MKISWNLSTSTPHRSGISESGTQARYCCNQVSDEKWRADSLLICKHTRSLVWVRHLVNGDRNHSKSTGSKASLRLARPHSSAQARGRSMSKSKSNPGMKFETGDYSKGTWKNTSQKSSSAKKSRTLWNLRTDLSGSWQKYDWKTTAKDNSDVSEARHGIIPKTYTSSKKRTQLYSTHPRKNGYSRPHPQKSPRKESLWSIPELVCIW